MTWEVVRHVERAGAFHARPVPEPSRRAVWVCEPTGPALVLGSAQPESVVDQAACARAGVEVVRRRSGGGAVLVVPGDLLWVDVVVPAGDALWQSDVGRAFHWVGRCWQDALADLGVATTAHTGGLLRSRWSDLVCFAGLGPGELRATSGAKVLGISQRRTRGAARFQCALLGRWDAGALTGLLALGPADRAVATAELGSVAAGAGVALDAALDALLHRLP